MIGESAALDLWQHLFGDRRGYFVGLFSGLRRRATGGNNLDEPHSAYFRWPDEGPAACRWIGDEDVLRGREVFYCAHGLTARRRIKANAAPLLACYVDGDGAKPTGSDIPAPTAVVESSPGREQLYWRLSRAVPPVVGESLNRRLALAMGGDLSGWDLTQLLRPPETHNRKYPDTPPVVLREALDAAYDPDELDHFLPPLPRKQPPEANRARRPKSVSPSPDLSRLSRRMRDLVRHGNNGEYPSRSEADMAACIAMFGAGYAEAEVWAAMTDSANGISEKFFEKGRDGELYLSLTIGKARACAQLSPRRTGKVYARRKEAVRLG